MKEQSSPKTRTITMPEDIYFEWRDYCKERGLIVRTLTGMIIREYIKNNP